LLKQKGYNSSIIKTKNIYFQHINKISLRNILIISNKKTKKKILIKKIDLFLNIFKKKITLYNIFLNSYKFKKKIYYNLFFNKNHSIKNSHFFFKNININNIKIFKQKIFGKLNIKIKNHFIKQKSIYNFKILNIYANNIFLNKKNIRFFLVSLNKFIEIKKKIAISIFGIMLFSKNKIIINSFNLLINNNKYQGKVKITNKAKFKIISMNSFK
jgi:hypothetical protein